jgi:tetratricopeptide (TPR) repeat protein
MLSGCSTTDIFGREYYLRFWENARLRADRAKLEGDLPKAESLARLSVRYAEHFGDADFRLAASLSELATILKLESRPQPAEQCLLRAQLILERALRKENEATARSLIQLDLASCNSWLAEIYIDRKSWALAIPLYKRAIELLNESKLASDPAGKWIVAPALIRDSSNLADAMVSSGNSAEAAKYYKFAFELSRFATAQNSVITHVKARYIDLLNSLGLSSEIEAVRAPDIWDGVAAEANNAMEGKDYKEAELLYRKAWLIAEHFSIGEPRRAANLRELAEALAWQHKYADSHAIYKQALAEKIRAGTEFSVETESILERLILGAQSPSETIAMAEQLLKIRRHLYGDKDESTAEPLIHLSDAYQLEGNQTRALSLANEAWLALKSTLPGNKNAALQVQKIFMSYASLHDTHNLESVLKKLGNLTTDQNKLAEDRLKASQLFFEENAWDAGLNQIEQVHNALPSMDYSQLKAAVYKLFQLSDYLAIHGRAQDATHSLAVARDLAYAMPKSPGYSESSEPEVRQLQQALSVRLNQAGAKLGR